MALGQDHATRPHGLASSARSPRLELLRSPPKPAGAFSSASLREDARGQPLPAMEPGSRNPAQPTSSVWRHPGDRALAPPRQSSVGHPWPAGCACDGVWECPPHQEPLIPRTLDTFRLVEKQKPGPTGFITSLSPLAPRRGQQSTINFPPGHPSAWRNPDGLVRSGALLHLEVGSGTPSSPQTHKGSCSIHVFLLKHPHEEFLCNVQTRAGPGAPAS